MLGLGAAFLTRLLETGVAAGPVVGYAAGMLVACESAVWAGSLGWGARVELRVVRSRGTAILGAAAVGALSSLVALLGGGVTLPAALAAATVGGAAAVAFFAGLHMLARRIGQATGTTPRRTAASEDGLWAPSRGESTSKGGGAAAARARAR
jgi:hypothetical protein